MSDKKGCKFCEEWKHKTEFHKNKTSKDLLHSKCKDCHKKYYIENREYLLKKDKERRRQKNEEINLKRREKYKNPEEKKKKSDYYYQHREKHLNDRKNGYIKNKEECKQQSKVNRRLPLLFDSDSKYRKQIELYEETQKSYNGNIECKCTYCGEGFEPSYENIIRRVKSINGEYTAGAENRLYCSKHCKNNCPVYRRIGYFESGAPTSSREVQPQLRQMVFERDNYTCQKCGKHKDELDCGIHCHHIYPLNESPITSADIDECETLCEKCHKEIHMTVPGCGYSEMKC